MGRPLPAESPFAWINELLQKPVAQCLACRRPYFPHLGGCDLDCAFTLPVDRFYAAMRRNRDSDRLQQKFSENRHRKSWPK
jgi:hypothetical protein